MSTVEEIEKAIERLDAKEQVRLLRELPAHLKIHPDDAGWVRPAVSKRAKPQWPDFEARLKKTFPHGAKGKPLSELVDELRGDHA